MRNTMVCIAMLLLVGIISQSEAAPRKPLQTFTLAPQQQVAQQVEQQVPDRLSHRGGLIAPQQVSDAAHRRQPTPPQRTHASAGVASRPEQSHAEIITAELPSAAADPPEYYPAESLEHVGYMLVPIMGKRSPTYAEMMADGPPSYYQQKGLLTNMGNFFQSMFPIEINVPDMFGSMMGYMQRIPFVNRWQEQQANKPRIYLFPQNGLNIPQNDIPQNDMNLPHHGSTSQNRYINRFKNAMIYRRYPSVMPSLGRIADEVQESREEDVRKGEEARRAEEIKREKEEAEVFSAYSKEMYYRNLNAYLQSMEEYQDPLGRRESNPWADRGRDVEQWEDRGRNEGRAVKQELVEVKQEEEGKKQEEEGKKE